jgi:hypothetical protein
MDGLATFAATAAGVLIGLAWIGAIVLVVGVFVFRHRRRAIRRGTYPVRLLPWYLGGTPEMGAEPPREEHRTKSRRR